MLICYLAVDLDGTPALESFTVSAADDDCDEKINAYLADRVTCDEDGGAVFCLAVTGKPGDRFEIKQDGVTVAVVVRA